MKKEKYKIPVWIKAVFLIVLLIIIAFGAVFFQIQKEAMQRQAEKRLASIARLKVDQIADWRNDQLRNAASIISRPYLAEQLTQWLLHPRDENRKQLLTEFFILKQQEHYINVLLADANGAIHLSLSGPVEVPEQFGSELSTAFKKQWPIMTDLHTDSHYAGPHLSVIAPLFAGKKPLGAVILTVDPGRFLYPLIQSWPVPSNSAETLLVRRDGNDVVFLNTLRHQPDTALKLRIPLSRFDLPAAMAIKGRKGVALGKDYRGVKVVSVVLPVPGSPWFMVTKIDAVEIFAPWRSRAVLLMALFVSTLGILGVLALLTWQHDQRKHYLSLYRFEAQLRAVSERHSITLKSIGDAVIATDARGRVDLMNPVAETLTGWTEDEAHGRPLDEVFNIINENTREPVESPVCKIMREGAVVGLANHTLLIGKYGKELPIADSGAPIRNPEGDIAGVVLVFRDQSEEYEYRKKISESEQQKILALEAADLGTWHHDLATDTITFDERGKQCYGFRNETVPFPDVIERVHPADTKRLQQEIGVTLDPNQDLDRFQSEYRVIHPNGNICWLSVKVQIHFSGTGVNRQPVSGYGTVQDITERKSSEQALAASEAKYRELVETANSVIIRWDKQGIIRFINEYGLGFFGYTAEEMLGREVRILLPKVEANSGRDVDDLVSDILIHPEQHTYVPNENITKDGRIVWVAWTNKAILDEQQNVREILAIGNDVTSLKEIEKALRESQERLRMSLAEKEILLKEIHHRVKNNMQVISSLVSLQADEIKDATMREVLLDVTHRVRSMAMVHEKLYQSADLARIEFDDYTRSLIGYLWRAHGTAASGIRLTADLEPVSLPINSAVPCGLILSELVSNALKHAFRDRDAGRVTVSLGESENGRVHLSVHDDGVGLPVGFDWTQAQSLGLRLVQMLAGQLRATVEFGSETGARFNVAFEKSKT